MGETEHNFELTLGPGTWFVTIRNCLATPYPAAVQILQRISE